MWVWNPNSEVVRVGSSSIKPDLKFYLGSWHVTTPIPPDFGRLLSVSSPAIWAGALLITCGGEGEQCQDIFRGMQCVELQFVVMIIPSFVTSGSAGYDSPLAFRVKTRDWRGGLSFLKRYFDSAFTLLARCSSKVRAVPLPFAVHEHSIPEELSASAPASVSNMRTAVLTV